MLFIDKISLDQNSLRVTQDGALVATVRASRVGVQDYLGSEVGKPEKQIVRVYRPDEEVFSKDAMTSFASVPVTNNHPPEAVTTDNFKKYSVGHVGEEVMRDGEYMRVSLICRDQATINDVMKHGKRELSCGYTCDLKWESGTTQDGQAYDAIQTNIRGNHLAIVHAARGGSNLRIGDGKMSTIMHDGLSIEVSDVAALAFRSKETALADSNAKVKSLETQVSELSAKVSTKDGEILALNAKVADTAMTPEKIDALVADRSALIDTAKKIVPTFNADGKTAETIKREVVVAKLGDAAKSLDDNGISGAFVAITATVAKDTVAALNFGTVPNGNGLMADTSVQDTAHAKMVAGLNASRSVN